MAFLPRHPRRNGRHAGFLLRRAGAAATLALLAALSLGSSAHAETLTVDNTTDAGAGSLRQAILSANQTPQPDRIAFSPGLSGTIALKSKLPNISAPLAIDGPGSDKLAISGGGTSSLLYLQVSGGGEVRVAGLTLRDGLSADGGAIASFGTNVVLAHSVLTANRATNSGGALNVTEGNLTLLDSEVRGNTATYPGGAIELYNAGMKVVDSKISDNAAGSSGGGIDVASAFGHLLIERSTISGNRAEGDGGGVSVTGSPSQPLVISDSKIADNHAAGNGGGLATDGGGHPLLHGATVEGNASGGSGSDVFPRIRKSQPKPDSVDVAAPAPTEPASAAGAISIITAPISIAAPQAAGPTATLLNGTALAPASAPAAIKGAISAANMISRTPYIWGGGHSSFYSLGYDCSGAVSFALFGGGFLSAPLASGQLESWGAPGPGRWLTVYANATHAYAVIAGLRWDTVGDARGSGPRWHLSGPYPQGFVARHPVGY